MDGQHFMYRPLLSNYVYISGSGKMRFNNYAAGSEHEPFTTDKHYLEKESVGVKMLPYLSSQNNKLFIHLLFRELQFDVDWGDDGKITQYHNQNVHSMVDDNGNTVLVGQKRIELPYFIEDKE